VTRQKKPDGPHGGSGSIALLFESKKLLTVLQTMAALSNDDTYKKFGELSKNYDGIRIGFDMKKKK
jgi:hypothetical protein